MTDKSNRRVQDMSNYELSVAMGLSQAPIDLWPYREELAKRLLAMEVLARKCWDIINKRHEMRTMWTDGDWSSVLSITGRQIDDLEMTLNRIHTGEKTMNSHVHPLFLGILNNAGVHPMTDKHGTQVVAKEDKQ